MLEQEIQVFEKNLPSFLKGHKEQFVLIKGENYEFFETEASAIERGIKKYGAASTFLVRVVAKEQPAINIPALSLGLLDAHL